MRRSPILNQLVFLLSQERLGRRSLACRTGLSEMTVRLELERLRNEGFVTMAKSGVALTNLGRERFLPLLSSIKGFQQLALTTLARDTVSVGALLPYKETGPAWWHRDHAIREGASGMVMLRYEQKSWCFTHNLEEIGTKNKHDERVIEATFPTQKEGDLLVIVSAPDRRRASLGLWRVITELLFPTR